ncbi:glycosyl hydrolase family 32 [Murimonas intestini]|uniref:beta-fructofuranosidase n=1 Tax=Murimonas intestini TaxID=1337051 RepID=A0AB73T0D5_9FIRM|nr:glycosyl hydrolase family 32 [Murimonas intestini]MCR1842349.1 glycosyl hydrolase family 32 [Murimonas intestini]MCR1867728.1 glycosyl hydrolase family 32 [Murimonas intestini]MCR1885960.1 glycosyl hydrolase family 32 [Murimonas intestini]
MSKELEKEMHQLYYQVPGTWFGDCMPFAYDGKFYLFHQRDNRNPVPFGEPFGWSLSVTEDFVHYEDYGTVIPGGTDEEQDQFIFAGCVFEAEGRFHSFYTGYNREYEKQGKKPQVLMHAMSDDLIHWEKCKGSLTFTPQAGYDPGDWRDPFVLWDKERQEYLLILGTRKMSPKTAQTGCTVYFTSKDLKEWSFKGDFYAPGIYTMHEMPDLFRMGDWWYHIFSEYSDRDKMVYRMAKSLHGPWIAPKEEAFDGRAYYAARTCELDKKRYLFGWLPTRENNEDTGNFQWAGVFVPHEVCQREDGTLGVMPPDTLWQAFGRERILQEREAACGDGRAAVRIGSSREELFRLEMEIEAGEGTKDFGLRFLENEETGQSFQYHFCLHENRVIFEKNPNWPWFQCMNLGLERQLPTPEGGRFHIRFIKDGTACVLYVNGTALSSRCYEAPGESISVFVTQGKICVRDISIAEGLV